MVLLHLNACQQLGPAHKAKRLEQFKKILDRLDHIAQLQGKWDVEVVMAILRLQKALGSASCFCLNQAHQIPCPRIHHWSTDYSDPEVRYVIWIEACKWAPRVARLDQSWWQTWEFPPYHRKGYYLEGSYLVSKRQFLRILKTTGAFYDENRSTKNPTEVLWKDDDDWIVPKTEPRF